MPPTLLSVAVGVLLGVGLLGAAFDRRSLAVVALAAGLPDADAVLAVLGVGAANASLHSAFVAVGAAGLLYYETERRERSWLRAQSGWYGVRVAWVAVAAYAVAGIGLDLFSTDAVALLYPLSDRYYAVVGKLVVSTQEGLVQTYVDIGEGWLGLASPGTVESHTVESHTVGSWWTPAGEERRLRLVESGWQAIVILTAAAAIPAKGLVERGDR